MESEVSAQRGNNPGSCPRPPAGSPEALAGLTVGGYLGACSCLGFPTHVPWRKTSDSPESVKAQC